MSGGPIQKFGRYRFDPVGAAAAWIAAIVVLTGFGLLMTFVVKLVMGKP